MKPSVLAIAAVTFALAACSSQEGKFTASCAVMGEDEGLSAAEAVEACDCTYKRLDATLDGKEMAQATVMIGMNNGELRDYIEANPESEAVFEDVQGSFKSCAM